MRHAVLLACLLPLGLTVAAQAATPHAPKVSSQQCGLSTPYNVLVDGGGVWLYRDRGAPKEIFFHDGTLSVDRQVRAISEADARRLRRMEAEAHALMPEAAGLARETNDIVFDSLAGVVEALTGSRRKVRGIERLRRDAAADIDRTLGRGRWDQDLFGAEFEARIEAAAEDMAGSIGRSVLWSVFTGGGGRLEKRMERMEAQLERDLERRSRALEERAAALCRHVETLDALQAELDYRHDGEPLRLIESSGSEGAGESVASGS